MRFLLDSHIRAVLAERLGVHGLDVEHESSWRDGSMRGAKDPLLLAGAIEEGRILVTSDRRSIPGLLTQLWEMGDMHTGVVFVDDETFPSHDIGRIERAVLALVEETKDWDWTNRSVTLMPVDERD